MADADQIELGPAPAAATAVVILAHGRGQSPEAMRELADALALPTIRFILPGAPGGSWYPARFLAPIANNEPALSNAIGRYAALLDGLIAQGVPAERIVLAGFSQGACLAAETLVRHPRRYGAALIFTGGLIGPPGTRWPAPSVLAGMPIYLTGSRTDEWVPASRVVETARILQESRAAVTLQIFERREHLVCDEEIAAARQVLKAVAARSRRPAAARHRVGHRPI